MISCQAAPPGNDDFEAAYTITGLPATAEGGNQEATRQPGEPNSPDGYGRASIWWRWTAPSSGWVEVNTLGSDYDTTLAVYSGNTLSGLTLLKYNDEAMKTRQSRLRFSAVGGTEYRIQVQSWFQAAGIAKLRIQAASAPQPPTLQGLTMTPDSIVLKEASEPATVAAKATITAPDGLAGASLVLTGPGGVLVMKMDLTEGGSTTSPQNPATGVYKSGAWDYLPTAVVGPDRGPSLVVGDWRPRVLLTDDFGESTAYGGPGEPALPEGSTPVVKVTGVEDSRNPEITSATVTPESIDVTNESRTLTVEVAANDDTGAVPKVFLMNSKGGGGIAATEMKLISGTSLDGVWQGSLVVPAHFAAGVYTLEYDVSDTVGRATIYSDREGAALPAGLQKTVTLTNSGAFDTTAPVITAVSLTPSRISADALPAQVRIRVEASEELGIAKGLAGFRTQSQTALCSLAKVSRTGNAEVREGTLEVNANTPPGSFSTYYSLTDQSGNEVSLGGGKSGFFGKPDTFPQGVPSVFTITPGTGDAFTWWRAKYSQLAGPQGEFDADADGDGFINAVEFLCGTDPLLASGPDKPDPLGDRAPFFSATPGGLRLEYRLDGDNLRAGNGTYWRIQPLYLRPAATPQWSPSSSPNVVKDLYRAELPMDGSPSGFLRLVLETGNMPTQVYWP